MAKPVFKLELGQETDVLQKLFDLVNRTFPRQLPAHKSGGVIYTRIMLVFLCRLLEIVNTILYSLQNLKPYPITVITASVRCLFEMHLNAKYISLQPHEYSLQYLQYYDAFLLKHQNNIRAAMGQISDTPELVEALSHQVQMAVSDNTSSNDKWSKKNIREMAKEADELLEYTLDYPILCAYVHGNVVGSIDYIDFAQGAFGVRNTEDEMLRGWLTSRAAQYFSCFLLTFSKEFELMLEDDILQCWK